MRITLAAIGRLKLGPELSLINEYAKRLPWKLDIRELEIKKNLPDAQRKTEETKLLLDACKDASAIIALDEQGKDLTSRAFADTIKTWQNAGISSLGIIIGGADGLDRVQLSQIQLKLSFGRMSLPHMLARVLICEQLYRAYTILEGHPYHRE